MKDYSNERAVRTANVALLSRRISGDRAVVVVVEKIKSVHSPEPA